METFDIGGHPFFYPRYINVLKSTKELLTIFFNVWVYITNFITVSPRTKRKEKYSQDVFATPALYLKTAVKQSVMLMSRVAQQDAPAPTDQS